MKEINQTKSTVILKTGSKKESNHEVCGNLRAKYSELFTRMPLWTPICRMVKAWASEVATVMLSRYFLSLCLNFRGTFKECRVGGARYNYKDKTCNQKSVIHLRFWAFLKLVLSVSNFIHSDGCAVLFPWG